MSIAPPVRDNHGNSPCIPPHLLGRLLDKLRGQIKAEKDARVDSWAAIDSLAKTIEAAKQ